MTQPDPQQLTSTGPGNPVAYPDRHWRKGDLELLVALAKGSTRRDAARAAGISERTAYRRLADPQFRTQLDTLRQRLLTARIQHEATPPPENAAAANTPPASSTDPQSSEPADHKPPRSTPPCPQPPDPPQANTDTESKTDPPPLRVVTVVAHRLVAQARRTHMGLARRGADTLLWQPELNRWLAAPTRDVNAVYHTEPTNTPPQRRHPDTDKPTTTITPPTRTTPPQTQPTPACTCGTQRRRPSVRRKCPLHRNT